MKRKPNIIIAAFVFTVAILLLGYFSFGIWTSLIFSSGFLGGFLLWLFLPSVSTFEGIRWPYWIAFFLFLLHRVEEKVMDFFDSLAEITGTPKPEILSFSVIALVILSVGAWLLIPLLMKRGYAFGSYLAWTFFAAMGITELAHFLFPLFTDEAYGYFPGMGSVVFLAPVAWWGMYRLSKSQQFH